MGVCLSNCFVILWYPSQLLSHGQHLSNGDCLEDKRGDIRTVLFSIVFHDMHAYEHFFNDCRFRFKFSFLCFLF